MSSTPSRSGSFAERSVDASTARTTMLAGTTGSTTSGVSISVRGFRSSSTTCRPAENAFSSRNGRSGIDCSILSATTTDDHAAVRLLALAGGLHAPDLAGGVVHDLPLVRVHGLQALRPSCSPHPGRDR